MTTTSRRQWTDETIREALLPLATELGRMPRRAELTERGVGGLWSAMGRHGGVDAWREVVAAQFETSVLVDTPAVLSDEYLRVAAYFLFENGHPGGAESHWFAAEREFATA
jgi:hypothetical protein